MAFDQDDLAKLVAGLGAAEELRPVIQEGLIKIQSFGPEVKSLFMGIALGVADINIAVIKHYEDAGFTRAESIQIWAIQQNRIVDTISKVKKTK